MEKKKTLETIELQKQRKVEEFQIAKEKEDRKEKNIKIFGDAWRRSVSPDFNKHKGKRSLRCTIFPTTAVWLLWLKCVSGFSAC